MITTDQIFAAALTLKNAKVTIFSAAIASCFLKCCRTHNWIITSEISQTVAYARRLRPKGARSVMLALVARRRGVTSKLGTESRRDFHADLSVSDV